MSTTTFGDVIQEGTGQPGQSASAVSDEQLNQSVSAQPEIDINDPRLTSEDLNINPEADAYAMPIPLPDGKWRAKLKQQDVKGAGGAAARYAPKLDSRGGAYLYTAAEATILAPDKPQYDGLKVPDYFIDTRPKRDGSMRVATILHKLGKPLPAKTNHKEAMDSLLNALAGEPEIGIETAWEASCQSCSDAAKAKGEYPPRPIIGMHRFPQVQGKDAAGKTVMTYDPHLPCPDNPSKHGTITARPRIVRYLALSELR